MKLPEIRISSSFLLYDNISRPVNELLSLKGEINKPLPTLDWVEQRVSSYRQAWEPHEKTIVKAMCEVFELEFYKPVLDVYIVPYAISQSMPTIISSRYEPDEFIDILTHELLHVLIADNKTYSGAEISQFWPGFMPELTMKVRNHVLVHAGLKHIYLDALKEPSRLQRDIEGQQRWPDYAKAWRIVERDGYVELIDNYKKYYKSWLAKVHS